VNNLVSLPVLVAAALASGEISGLRSLTRSLGCHLCYNLRVNLLQTLLPCSGALGISCQSVTALMLDILLIPLVLHLHIFRFICCLLQDEIKIFLRAS